MTSMTMTEQIITIAMVVLGTMATRFLPFLIFPAGKPTPKYIQFLGMNTYTNTINMTVLLLAVLASLMMAIANTP